MMKSQYFNFYWSTKGILKDSGQDFVGLGCFTDDYIITDLWLHELTGVKVHVSQAALYMVETPKTKRHVIINFAIFTEAGSYNMSNDI